MKKIIAIIIAAVMLLSLCGCGAGNETPVQTAETESTVSEENTAPEKEAEIPATVQPEPESGTEEIPAEPDDDSAEEKQESETSASETVKEAESEASEPEKAESRPDSSAESTAEKKTDEKKTSQSEADPHAWGENDEVGEITEDPYESYTGPKINVTVAINSSNMGSAVAGNTSVSIPEGSSAYTAIKTALDKMGMNYVMSASYLKSIDGLSDMDGGPMSGWLYYVNGKKPNYAINGYTMKDGDTILLYYTITGMD